MNQTEVTSHCCVVQFAICLGHCQYWQQQRIDIGNIVCYLTFVAFYVEHNICFSCSLLLNKSIFVTYFCCSCGCIYLGSNVECVDTSEKYRGVR